jgi:hypothetical protein
MAALAAVPGATPVPLAEDALAESTVVAGVEVGRATTHDEQELRKLWRGRFGGGPTPLLLIADAADEEGAVVALGPLGHDGPLRLIGADDLVALLKRLPSLAKLEAVRHLAEELGRLDRSGRIPRMGEPGWLPDHTEEWREDYKRSTPGLRVAQAIELSRFQTRIAARARGG